MTHADITAKEILDQIPDPIRARLQNLAIRRKVPMTTLIKEGLIAVADQINASSPKPTRPSGYTNASAA
jgi:hypothetical protein